MKAWMGIFALALLGSACEQTPGESPKEKAERAATQGPALAGGTKHEPPIEKDAVAAGHFYCDMGTVHFSRPDAGDGTCPICGMKLVEKK